MKHPDSNPILPFPGCIKSDPYKICSLDQLEVGKSYTFDPPLDTALVVFNSKHQSRHGELRHPAFLGSKLIEKGVSSGKLINKSEFDESNNATATFLCEAQFLNGFTGKEETVIYSATCKFSRDAANGIRINVCRTEAETDDTVQQNQKNVLKLAGQTLDSKPENQS